MNPTPSKKSIAPSPVMTKPQQTQKPSNPLLLATQQGAILGVIVFLVLLITGTGVLPRVGALIIFPLGAFMFSANLLFFIHAACVPGGIEYRFNVCFGGNGKTTQDEETPDAATPSPFSRFHYEASESFSIGKRR